MSIYVSGKAHSRAIHHKHCAFVKERKDFVGDRNDLQM